MYRVESSRLWGRGQTSQFLHSFLVSMERLSRSLIDLQREIIYRGSWGVYSPGSPGTWLGYHSQILVHWFWLYTMSRTASREDCGQILPLVMLRGRSLLGNRGQWMSVPLVLPVRGLLDVISRSHSFSRLILHIHLNSIDHGRLVWLMISPTCHRLWLYLIIPPRALRDPQFPT